MIVNIFSENTLLSVVSILMFLMVSVSLFLMSKEKGFNYSWLVFVPIGIPYWFYFGKLIEHKLGRYAGLKNTTIWVGLFLIEYYNIPYIQVISGLIIMIYTLLSIEWLFSRYTKRSFGLSTLCFFTFGLAYPFIMLRLATKSNANEIEGIAEGK